MNVSDAAEPLSPGGWIILRVTRWESVQFRPAIRGKRVETFSVPLPRFRTISDAHASDREAAFVRRISSFSRVGRSHAGVRFHTTLKSQADTW